MASQPDLRKYPRRPFNYAAAIVVDTTTPPRPCRLADVSHSGARLVLERDEELPDRFVLLLTHNGEARRHCRVVWRMGTTLGVEFLNG
jgi:PilZ domain